MRNWIIPLTLLLAAACDPPPPPVPVVDAGPPRDAGSRDAGSIDAGEPADAGPDAGSFDAGGTDAAVPRLDCTVIDDAPLSLDSDRLMGDRAIRLVPGVDAVGAVWIASPSVGDVIRFVRVPSSGGAPGFATDIASVGRADSPAMARAADGSWIVAWSDTSLGNYELRSAVLEPTGQLRGAIQRLTDNAVRDERATLLARPTGALVAWVQSNSTDFEPRPMAMPLGADGAATASAMALTGFEGVSLHESYEGAVALDIRGGELHARSVGDDGAPGASQRLDMAGTATGSAGLAVGATTGLAAFAGRVSGVRADIRVVPLDMDGARRAPVRSITPPPEQGHSSSIGAVAGGYAVAYRAQVGSETIVRLSLVSPLGDRVGVFDVAGTSAGGGDVSLAVASDGRIVLAWRTEESDTTRIQLARVECNDG